MIDSSDLPEMAMLLWPALDQLEEGVSVFNASRHLVFCNAPFRELRDYPESVCRVGTHISELYRHNAHRKDYGDVDIEAEVARRVELSITGGARAFDQVIAGGIILYVRYVPLARRALLFSYEDVTEKRATEAKLTESNERHALAMEAVNEGVYDWNIETAMERGMFPLANDNREQWLEELLKRRGSTSGARQQHLSNGLWLQVSDHRMSDGGLVSVYVDITELKRGQEALRTAKDAAEGALEELRLAQRSLVQSEKMASLGQLTAGIAHEIKNPLHFVNNFSKSSMSLLEELDEALSQARSSFAAQTKEEIDDLVETLKEDLASIVEHGERADGIVKGMLLHSRGDSGGRQVMDLNALLDESVNLAYHGQRAATPGFNVTLDKEFDAGVGEFEVVSQEITRVFVNLLANAFYAVRRRELDGGKEFAPCVRIATRRTAPNRAEIRIRDNGTGMSRATLDKLFTPFFTTKPPGEGTGLGLSISHDIVVAQHGGAMKAESVQGEFTEFVLELPQKMPPAASG